MQFSNTDSPAPQQTRIAWTRMTPSDCSGIDPETHCDGFWPSLDPESDGYIGGPDATDVDGKAQLARFREQEAAAQERVDSFARGDWEYIGIVARADIMIPIGGNSFRVMQLESAGLWGIESDSDESYLQSVFEEERESLLGELRTLGQSLGADATYFETLPPTV